MTAEELFLQKYGNKITAAESWVIRFAEEFAGITSTEEDCVKKSEFEMHKHIQQIVNIQVDINRAVWAANLTSAQNYGACNSKINRDNYIENCLKSAYSSLKNIIPNHQTELEL